MIDGKLLVADGYGSSFVHEVRIVDNNEQSQQRTIALSSNLHDFTHSSPGWVQVNKDTGAYLGKSYGGQGRAGSADGTPVRFNCNHGTAPSDRAVTMPSWSSWTVAAWQMIHSSFPHIP